jgi:hypothetical protein
MPLRHNQVISILKVQNNEKSRTSRQPGGKGKFKIHRSGQGRRWKKLVAKEKWQGQHSGHGR